MKCIIIILFSVISLLGQKELEKIYIYDAPELTKNKSLKNNSVYGIVDLNYDYKKLYNIYFNNTKDLENGHFSKKVAIKSKKENYLYHLVFRHWFVGQLFKLAEEHKKITTSWWPSTHALFFPPRKKTEMWTVKKYLLNDSKSSWVGSNLQHLQMFIAFINMGKGKTRLYLHMVIDAKGCRTKEGVINEVIKAAEKIMELATLQIKR